MVWILNHLSKPSDMKSAFVIFNGIRFPFNLMDKAMDWAVAHQASLTAIFLHSSEQLEEGYGFPSDIDAAEELNTDADAERSNETLIRGYFKLLLDNAAAKKISLKIESRTDESKEELVAELKKADKVFLDGGRFEEDIPWGASRFTMQELGDEIGGAAVMVAARG
jgi:hypothetical protein